MTLCRRHLRRSFRLAGKFAVAFLVGILLLPAVASACPNCLIDTVIESDLVAIGTAGPERSYLDDDGKSVQSRELTLTRVFVGDRQLESATLRYDAARQTEPEVMAIGRSTQSPVLWALRATDDDNVYELAVDGKLLGLVQSQETLATVSALHKAKGGEPVSSLQLIAFPSRIKHSDDSPTDSPEEEGALTVIKVYLRNVSEKTRRVCIYKPDMQVAVSYWPDGATEEFKLAPDVLYPLLDPARKYPPPNVSHFRSIRPGQFKQVAAFPASHFRSSAKVDFCVWFSTSCRGRMNKLWTGSVNSATVSVNFASTDPIVSNNNPILPTHAKEEPAEEEMSMESLELMTEITGACHLTDIVKLLIACILGGVIGLERELTKHPAGLRTHILVSLGSAAFVISGIFMATQTGIHADPGRIMQGVITGVGFIGAGAIMKDGLSVRGLTTAASLWVASAVGLLVGIGMLYLALALTVLSFLALLVSRHAEGQESKDSEE